MSIRRRVTEGYFSRMAADKSDNDYLKKRNDDRAKAMKQVLAYKPKIKSVSQDDWKGGSQPALKKEEVEPVNELSKKTLGKYIKKAVDRKGGHDWSSGTFLGGKESKSEKYHDDKSMKRGRGITTAVKKLTKEEIVNELSKKTLGSYIKKASGTSHEKSAPNLASRGGFELGGAPLDMNGDAGEAYDKAAVKRTKKIAKAVDKIVKEDQVFEAKKKTKSAKTEMKRKYMGKMRGTTLTGKTAHEIITSPKLSGEKQK